MYKKPFLQKITDSILQILPIPATLSGNSVFRKEPCRQCNESVGMRIASVDFWDLHEANIIHCEKCGLTQLDPMPSSESLSVGCTAYHYEELIKIAAREQKRNLVRNYRRGIAFAYKLKRLNITPKQMLEFGPGSGYFAAGMQFVFPKLKVTVLDIVDDVLVKNKQIHGFETVKGLPENYIEELKNKFDFIIARDIIEHVNDFPKMLQNISDYLKKDGYFHFITPNGHEDVWRFYVREQLSAQASELKINHVNYFDGKGLLNLLFKHCFVPVNYYTYQFKTTRRGRGWRIREKNAEKISQKYSAKKFLQERQHLAEDVKYNKEDVLKEWYLKSSIKSFAGWYCRLKHYHFFKASPELKIGHEIFGLFKKP
jgi:2-polyprenyl-3-methyl-5-hydroxy-6-metoxy-1,4-benzoquinol methylase